MVFRLRAIECCGGLGGVKQQRAVKRALSCAGHCIRAEDCG